MSVEVETLTALNPKPAGAKLKRLGRHGTLLISLATIAVIIAGWSLASAYGAISPVFLPSPLVVVKSLYNVAVNGFVDSTLAAH
ncbi:MAG: taurine ABC transporter permease, partial [Rhizobiaceae bacterium]|nr:taurine ABC transporter permease [Rhizobiaceae bacterium]